MVSNTDSFHNWKALHGASFQPGEEESRREWDRYRAPKSWEGGK